MEQIPDKKNPSAQPLSPEDKKKVSDMAKFLARAVSQAHDFGINHPLTKQPIEDSFNILNKLIPEKGNIAVYVAEKKLRYGDTILEERNPVVDKLISLFAAVKVVSLEFERGFSRDDFSNFLSIFAMRSQDILNAGGIEKLCKEKNIGHLKLNPIKYELIGMGEKVVSREAKLKDEDLSKELEKIFAQTEEGVAAEVEEEKPEEKLLYLIDPSLREDSGQAVFVDKLIRDPLDEVHSIVETVRLVNKVGGEKAKVILTSINKKLNRVRDDLYMCLVENKEDEATKKIYKSAGVLGKELTKQLKTIQVGADLSGLVEEMTNIVTMIMDQTEAQRMLSGFLKGEATLKKKAAFLKSMVQRQKLSADFEFMMKKVLVSKGMSEQDVSQLMEQKLAILEEAGKEKEALGLEMETQLRSENERLTVQAKAFNLAFSNIDEGIMLFDEEEKIIFSNKSAEQIMGLGAGSSPDKAALAVLKIWQPAAAIDLDQFLKDNQIDEKEKERLGQILSSIKTTQKNEKGQLSIILFKPLP